MTISYTPSNPLTKASAVMSASSDTDEVPRTTFNSFLGEISKAQNIIYDFGTKVANVEDYARALGLGASDDCTQAVLNAVANDGTRQLVYFPRQYIVQTNQIVVPARRLLIANMGLRHSLSGIGSTYFNNINSALGGLYSTGTGTMVNITGGGGMMGMHIRFSAKNANAIGVKINDTPDSSGQGFYQNDDGMLVNNWIVNAGTGLSANKMQGWGIIGNAFDGDQNTAVLLSEAVNCSILGNRIFYALYYGMRLTSSCAATSIVGNVFDFAGQRGENTAPGISIEDSFNLGFAANQINTCGRGVNIANSTDIDLVGTRFAAIKDDCITISGSSMIEVSGGGYRQVSCDNRPDLAQTENGDRAFLRTSGTNSRIIVVGPKIQGTTGHNNGIIFASGTTYSLIDNLICSNVGTPYTDGGANNTVGRVIS